MNTKFINVSNLLKLCFLSFLSLVMSLPFSANAATPVPVPDSGSTNVIITQVSNLSFPVPLQWSVSYDSSTKLYSYVYTLNNNPSGTGTTLSPSTFWIQLDPSITAANFSQYVPSISVDGSINNVTVGINTAVPVDFWNNVEISVTPGHNIFDGIDLGQYPTTTLTLESTLAPVFGNAEVTGGWQGSPGNCTVLICPPPPSGTFGTQGNVDVATIGPVPVVPTPEPSTWILMSSALGLIGIFGLNRNAHGIIHHFKN